MENQKNDEVIIAHPIRVIPFDLGRELYDTDFKNIYKYLNDNSYIELNVTPRQASILKDCHVAFVIDAGLSLFVYKTGIIVFVIEESYIEYINNRNFSILYGENRKKAHSELFKWNHRQSSIMWSIVKDLRFFVLKEKKSERIRSSASEEFENKGLSYIMTLSLFDWNNKISGSFKDYPDWMKSNIYAMLDPAVLYLEDSSKFESSTEIEFDLDSILNSIEIDQNLHDYEKHRHLDTYMSWAAVIGIGKVQKIDIEEYVALEVQLQSDWFYVYCLDKTLDDIQSFSKKDIVDLQRKSYTLDLIDNRLYDFDDSSMPTRILDLQKGMVDTSGLSDNMQRLQRKIKYILEREQLDGALKQKKLGQSTEILLFFIAFIEIAPTVAEYGEHLFHNAGIFMNCIIVVIGIVLLLRKE